MKTNLKTRLMKLKLILSLLLFSFCIPLIAQDSNQVRSKEFYLSVSTFSPLRLQLKYKQQIGNHLFFKVGLVELSMSKSKTESTSTATVFPYQNTGYSGGLELGLEFRTTLIKNFSVFHGPNLRYTYFYQQMVVSNPGLSPEEQKSTNESQEYSIPYTLGILFNLNSNLLLAAEVNPNVYYTHSRTSTPNASNYLTNDRDSFGFTISNSTLLSLVFRF